MEIKSLSAIRDKWTRVTPQRTEDYRLGIRNPLRDWAEQTIEAATNWKSGVDRAHAAGLFVKGVERAGTAKWQKAALEKGPGRYAEGVALAGPDFEKGYAPYRAALAALDIGPRFPRRDPRNLDRVKRVVDAMIKTKLEQ